LSEIGPYSQDEPEKELGYSEVKYDHDRPACFGTPTLQKRCKDFTEERAHRGSLCLSAPNHQGDESKGPIEHHEKKGEREGQHFSYDHHQ